VNKGSSHGDYLTNDMLSFKFLVGWGEVSTPQEVSVGRLGYIIIHLGLSLGYGVLSRGLLKFLWFYRILFLPPSHLKVFG